MNIHRPSLAEQERFQAISDHIIRDAPETSGIGTLGEKTLHAILKRYLEPDAAKHETVVEGYVADIANGDGVVEIQTANFDRLRRKLDTYLPDYPLKIVHPIPADKFVCWYDTETGEQVSRRRSPKKGRSVDALRELYRIRQWLLEPGLTIEFYFVDLEEHRLLNGWDKSRKRGSTRVDRLPLALDRVERLEQPEDYLAMLPEELPAPFKTKDVMKKGKMTDKQAFVLLRILRDFGLVTVNGKDGNAYLFERTPLCKIKEA